MLKYYKLPAWVSLRNFFTSLGSICSLMFFYSCDGTDILEEMDNCVISQIDFSELYLDSTFENPILPGGPDPWIVQHKGMYYYTYTHGGKLVILETKNPSELASARRYEVWSPPAGTAYSKNIWAPELHRIEDKWYFYFAADDGQNANHRMYVLENESDSPVEGSWEFKGKLSDVTDQWAIDGTVFTYQDELYTIWSGGDSGAPPQELFIAKMENPWTIIEPKICISSPDYDWEKYGNPINEGPQVLKNSNDDVFIVYSASGYWVNNYCLGLLKLEMNGNPLNPSHWKKQPKPVFSMKSESNTYGPGHNGFFTSPDDKENWIIYHARTGPDGGSRNPRIQSFDFDFDGFPVFGEPVSTAISLKKPSGEVLRWKYLKDNWTIEGFSSEEQNNSRLAKRLIDNNIETYWITRYSEDPTNYPDHWITIDTKSMHYVDGFSFVQKNDDRRIKNIQILISENNEDWEDLGNFFLFNNGGNELYVDLLSRKHLRYFKLVPIDGHDAKEQPGLAEVGMFLLKK